MDKMITKTMGNKIARMLTESRHRMEIADECISQDNADLKYLEKRYDDLDISLENRRIIDDYIACIHSREERRTEVSYFAGITDAVIFLKKNGIILNADDVEMLMENLVRDSAV